MRLSEQVDEQVYYQALTQVYKQVGIIPYYQNDKQVCNQVWEQLGSS